MRYYRIEVGSSNQTAVWTSHPYGISQPPDPGALDIELDCLEVTQSQAPVGSYVRIWGIPIQQIGQANKLYGQPIKIYGGMGVGLPLANPGQAGLLAQGIVYQAFGNWSGRDQTLDLYLAPGGTTDQTPRNLSFQWKAGTALSDAIQTALQSAYSEFTADVSISPGLKLNHDEVGFYRSLPQFTKYVNGVSLDILGSSTPGYNGVDLAFHGSTILVRDGTTPQTPKQIQFTDLIGQPTWIDAGHVQATLILRGDLKFNDYLTLPPGLVTVTAQSLPAYSQYRQGSLFKGTFSIQQIRHVGRYKNPPADGWMTILTMPIVSSGTS